MIILITGASHTGKTVLAQKLLEKYHYPYLSIDHLKMGLIRSGNTDLTPMDDDDTLTAYLWPIVREMIRTAVENNQNLIVEGCYIPFDWERSFEPEYRAHIRGCFIVMSKAYIEAHYQDIIRYRRAIEDRLPGEVPTMEELIRENGENLRQCEKFGCSYILLKDRYHIDLEQIMGE